MKQLTDPSLIRRRRAARQFAALLLAGCVAMGSAVTPAAESDGQGAQAAAATPATWSPRKLHFMYSTVSPSSTTTYYSCDSLQSKITSILRQLNARDVVVKQAGCINPNGPDRFPGVDATFSVLEPVANGAGAALSQHVSAQWDTVTLSSDPRNSDASCSLMEQVKQRILPLFATRNVGSACSQRFSLEVLRPVEAK